MIIILNDFKINLTERKKHIEIEVHEAVAKENYQNKWIQARIAYLFVHVKIFEIRYISHKFEMHFSPSHLQTFHKREKLFLRLRLKRRLIRRKDEYVNCNLLGSKLQKRP